MLRDFQGHKKQYGFYSVLSLSLPLSLSLSLSLSLLLSLDPSHHFLRKIAHMERPSVCIPTDNGKEAPYWQPASLPDMWLREPSDDSSPQYIFRLRPQIWWKWKSLSHIWLFATPWNSPGQNTGVGSLSVLQGIFPTQGSNPDLPHCRWILYQLSHQGSPRILEWVAYLFSSRSSWPRNWTGVSWIAGSFFTSWATSLVPCLNSWPAGTERDNK